MFDFTQENFTREVINAQEPVLVDFFAIWCAPCKVVAPIVEGLADEFKGVIKMGKLNVDDNPEIASQFAILNIPTLILFKDGQEVSRIIGVNSKEAITAKIRGVLSEK